MGRESGNGYGAGVQQQWRETSYSQTEYTFVARLLGYLLHIFSLYFNFSLLQIGICIWFQLWWVSDGTGGRYSGLALIRNDPFHRFESSNTSRVIKIMRCFTWIPLESHLNRKCFTVYIISHKTCTFTCRFPLRRTDHLSKSHEDYNNLFCFDSTLNR